MLADPRFAEHLLLFTPGVPREAYFEELAEIAAPTMICVVTRRRRTDERERILG